MRNNKNLNLNDLKVKSFVTSFDNKVLDTVKGGIGTASTFVPFYIVATATALAAGVAVGVAINHVMEDDESKSEKK